MLNKVLLLSASVGAGQVRVAQALKNGFLQKKTGQEKRNARRLSRPRAALNIIDTLARLQLTHQHNS